MGIYRLIMKKGSDNFRTSAVMEILRMIKEKNIKTYIFEPLLNQEIFDDSIVIHDLNEFKSRSDLIIANRISADLEDIKSKVYCRDIYKRD